MRRLLPLLVVGLFVMGSVAAAPTDNPGKGKGKPQADASAAVFALDGTPTFGTIVTYTVDRTAWVHARCWQSFLADVDLNLFEEVLVYEEYHLQYADGEKPGFMHGPTSLWTSGEARCTATEEAGDGTLFGQIDYTTGA